MNAKKSAGQASAATHAKQVPLYTDWHRVGGSFSVRVVRCGDDWLGEWIPYRPTSSRDMGRIDTKLCDDILDDLLRCSDDGLAYDYRQEGTR